MENRNCVPVMCSVKVRAGIIIIIMLLVWKAIDFALHGLNNDFLNFNNTANCGVPLVKGVVTLILK